MKSHKAVRNSNDSSFADDVARKSVKLAPIRKSGKDRYNLYGELDDEDDGIEEYKQRESALDYYDDTD